MSDESLPPEPTPVEERLIEAHCDMRDRPEPEKLFFNHSVLCQTSLPYRNPGDDVRYWERKQGAVSLSLEAGRAVDRQGDWHNVGLPYGPRSRLLLIHICSEAKRQRSPHVEIEDSMTAFARKIGLKASGGRNLRTLRDQLNRLANTSIRLAMRHDGGVHQVHTPLFQSLQVFFPSEPRQREMWPSVVELAPAFFAHLEEHAVPLDIRAVRALQHSCRALDIYQWLAQRLWRVNTYRGGDTISWFAIRDQFGNRQLHMGHFKRRFRQALKQVLYAYDDARLAVEETKDGLILRHAPPPIRAWQPGMLTRTRR